MIRQPRIESVETASRPAIFSGKLSSGSPSSRRIFVTLIDMGGGTLGVEESFGLRRGGIGAATVKIVRLKPS